MTDYDDLAKRVAIEWSENRIETSKIKLENRVRLQMAASVLREVLPGLDYGINLNQLREITKPLSEAITRALATDD